MGDTYRTRSVAVPADYLSYEKSIRHREKHLDILAVAMIVLGAIDLLLGLALSGLFVFAGLDSGQADPSLRIVFPVLAVGVLVVFLSMAVWLSLTGWGLHRRTHAARISTYVLGALFCLHPMLLPMGIYTLWVVAGEVANMAFGRFAHGQAARPAPAAQADVPPRQAPHAVQAPATHQGPPAEMVRQPIPLPPDPGNRRAGSRSYPRPPIGVPTPPAGVARPNAGLKPEQSAGTADPASRAGEVPASHLDSLATVKDMPSPFRPSGPAED